MVYDVISEPPVSAAVKGIETVVLFVRVTVPSVGVLGTVVAVIEFDAAVESPLPDVVVPYAVKVYAVSDCNPVTVMGDVAEVAVKLPGLETAVIVSGTPPFGLTVNGMLAAPLLYARDVPTFVTEPRVGISARSAIFVPPADASLYFFHKIFESLAFLVAIMKVRFRMLGMKDLLLKHRHGHQIRFLELLQLLKKLSRLLQLLHHRQANFLQQWMPLLFYELQYDMLQMFLLGYI